VGERERERKDNIGLRVQVRRSPAFIIDGGRLARQWPKRKQNGPIALARRCDYSGMATCSAIKSKSETFDSNARQQGRGGSVVAESVAPPPLGLDPLAKGRIRSDARTSLDVVCVWEMCHARFSISRDVAPPVRRVSDASSSPALPSSRGTGSGLRCRAVTLTPRPLFRRHPLV
jgi:hypothetical protein